MAVYGLYISENNKQRAKEIINSCKKVSIDLDSQGIKMSYSELLLEACSIGLPILVRELRNENGKEINNKERKE